MARIRRSISRDASISPTKKNVKGKRLAGASCEFVEISLDDIFDLHFGMYIFSKLETFSIHREALLLASKLDKFNDYP